MVKFIVYESTNLYVPNLKAALVESYETKVL